MPGPTSSPDTTSNVREAARAAVAGVNVALPATVVAYDEATQLATVKLVPCFRRRDPSQGGAVVCYDPPDLPGVPVAFPGAGDWSITWPLAAGDAGLVVFADRSLSEWKATGADRTEPQDPRRHDLTDAVFVPGLRSPADALPAAAVDASALVIRGATIKLGSSAAADAVALASKVDTQLQAIKNMLDTWVVIPNDGGAALKALWTILSGTGWPGDTGASKVVAE